MKTIKIFIFALMAACQLQAQSYADQHYFWYTETLWDQAVEVSNVQLNADSSAIILQDGQTNGTIDFAVQNTQEPFNRLLPSWNGWAPESNGGFKVLVRFPMGEGWSPWLNVGFWKEYVFNSYGSTTYEEGYIDYDYAVLDNYLSEFQFRVSFRRNTAALASPSIHKLSAFVSDSRTTDNANMTAIMNDDPPEIFIPTSFVCQYNVDPEIGGSICSPTSVVMILRSYDIEVDAYEFALDNYDPWYGIFGIWPRAVQNGSTYGVDGAVTRYRTWSECYEVLAAGGRISMSVGQPLYSGHLIMLAGFDENGDPLVHDPARQDGYAYHFTKISLSQSWFNKGGVGYTFFPGDTTLVDIAVEEPVLPRETQLYPAFPNPFNAATILRFNLDKGGPVTIHVHDLQGRRVQTLAQGNLSAGTHRLQWNGSGLSAGTYLITLHTAKGTESTRVTLLK